MMRTPAFKDHGSTLDHGEHGEQSLAACAPAPSRQQLCQACATDPRGSGKIERERRRSSLNNSMDKKLGKRTMVEGGETTALSTAGAAKWSVWQN